MDVDEVVDKIESWVYTAVDCGGAQEDGFFVDEYEHAAVVRWGSKMGDFPALGGSSLLGELNFIISGVKNGTTIISDMDAKTPVDLEKMAYNYFLETLMKSQEMGYEIITKPINGEAFKIRVEKINSKV